MRYNKLGNTGLIVSEICLGAMTFGETSGRFANVAGLKQDEATALVKQALDAGVNFIDTANVYSEASPNRGWRGVGRPWNRATGRDRRH